VVFRYKNADGAVLYDKYRPVGNRKVFWRVPRGCPSALYGLEDLATADREQIIVVEGELDLHALRAVGIGPVVSVPDGCGSRLTRQLLAPLAPFRLVVIATDADPAGDTFAIKLATALGPERCRRVRFAMDDGGKDANDALKAGWTRERFQR